MRRVFKKLAKLIEVKQTFRRLGLFIEKRHLILLIVGIVLVVPAIGAATQVEMKTGFETFVSSDSQTYKDFEKFNEHFSSNVLVVLISGNSLYELLQPQNVAAMESLETEMADDPSVISTVGPVFLMRMINFQKNLSMELPEDPYELSALIVKPGTGEILDDLKNVFPDNRHALIAITLDGGLSQGEQGKMVSLVEEFVSEAGFEGVDVIVSGHTVVFSKIEELMLGDMTNMLILSITLMLLILAFIFNVRGFFAWRWLPLGAVGLAIIYTFGVMGVVSIPITMVTMSVFPILIGLGVDYAIQFHNRYDEESKRVETVAAAILEAITHIGPAIGIAIVAACLGFLALFFSPVPMIQDFGYTLIIGVAICYLISIFVLMSALYRRDRLADARKAEGKEPRKLIKPRNKLTLGPEIAASVLTLGLVGLCIVFIATDISLKDTGFVIGIGITGFAILASVISLGIELHRERTGILSTIREPKTRLHVVDVVLNRMGPWVIKHPLIIIPIALILTTAGLVADHNIEPETDEMKFISQDLAVIENLKIVEDVAGGLASLSVLVEAQDVTEPHILSWMTDFGDRVKAENPEIINDTNSVSSALIQLTEALGLDAPQTAQEAKNYLGALPSQIRANLITEDYTTANIIVTIGDMRGEQVKETERLLWNYISDHPEGTKVTVTGMPLISAELLDSLRGGRVKMHLIGLGLVFAGLLVLFRFRILKVCFAVLPIALISGWSSGVMFLAGIKYTPATATIGALIIGIGVHFTILLMTRYYEEREKGLSPGEAMIIAIQRIGRAIIASGLTVIGGFAALLIAQYFPILRDFGIVTMVNVLFALISTLVVLPPLIVWVDTWREKRALVRVEAEADSG